MSQPAIFLDRDGVLNRNVFNPSTGAWEAPLRPGQLELYPDTLPALLRLHSAGYALVIVSNQPNYAKGKSTLEDHQAIHALLEQWLALAGLRLTAALYCLHHPLGRVFGYSATCPCRKPAPGLVLAATRRFHLELSRSWMIGDRITDIECGRRAGVRTIFINREDSESHSSEAHSGLFGPASAALPRPTLTVGSLGAAVQSILAEPGRQPAWGPHERAATPLPRSAYPAATASR